MLVTFQGMSVWGRKAGKCRCGKRRSRRREFSQTLSPFNLNADGQPKTRSEIYAELRGDVETWQQEPITCVTCKDPLQVARAALSAVADGADAAGVG